MENENKTTGRKTKDTNEMYNSAFATRLRSLIEENNLTQAAVAQEMNTTRQTIGNWMLGKSQPDFDTLIKLADYFNTTTDFLLGHSPNRTTDIDIQAISDYTGLSDLSITILRSFYRLKKAQQRFYKARGEKSPSYIKGTFDTYKIEKSDRSVFEIDFIDWFLRKMNYGYEILNDVTEVANLKYLKTEDGRIQDGDEWGNLIMEYLPDSMLDFVAAGTFITGSEYRRLLLNKSKEDFNRILNDFDYEFSPHTALSQKYHTIEDSYRLFIRDLEKEVDVRIEDIERAIEEMSKNNDSKKDGDT